MSRTSFSLASAALVALGILALAPRIGSAQSTEITPEKLDELVEVYAELRREDPELEARSREQIAADVQELLRARRERARDTTAVTARSADGSVVASARCKEGHVVNGRHTASDRAVTIVSEDVRDCDADGCRAYQVNAVSESTEPFDLSVSVVCAD